MTMLLCQSLILRTLQVGLIWSGLLFSSCNPVLGVLTANWKRQLAYLETDDYEFRIKQNLYMGCPKAESSLTEDQIFFENVKLPEAIRLLANNTSRVEFINLNESNETLRIDVDYSAKKDLGTQANKDTVLSLMGKTINYSVSTDSVTKKVYTLKITDSKKLKPVLIKESSFRDAENSVINAYRLNASAQNKSGFKINDDNIVFTNCSLKTICGELERNMAVYIGYDLVDTRLYSMVVPTGTPASLRNYFISNGIDLIEDQKKILITQITFKDKP